MSEQKEVFSKDSYIKIESLDDGSRLKMTEINLKPCPFCGTAPIILRRTETLEQDIGKVVVIFKNIYGYHNYIISCDNSCCAVHPEVTRKDLDEAVERWNERMEAIHDSD